MTTTHTPGPWITTKDAVILAKNPQNPNGAQVEIAQVHNVYGADAFCQAHTNCYLIAAAPEMLEALHHILNIEGQALNGEFPDAPDCVPWHFNKVRAAIAKAEGR